MNKTKYLMTIALAAVFSLSTYTVLAEQGQEGNRGSRGKHGGKHHKMKTLEELDTNQDGNVTLDEFLASHMERITERFKKLDTNQDGSVTQAEMDEHRERMRERFKDGRGKHRDGSGKGNHDQDIDG